MWWNPKLPLDMRPAASRPTGGESALASLARDMAASQAGSRCGSPLSSQLAAETQCIETECICACLLAHFMSMSYSLPVQLASRAHASPYTRRTMLQGMVWRHMACCVVCLYIWLQVCLVRQHSASMACCAGLAVHLHGVLRPRTAPQCRMRCYCPQSFLSLNFRHCTMDISELKQTFWDKKELTCVPDKCSCAAADTQGAIARAGSASSSLRTLLSLHKVACMLPQMARLLRRLQNVSAKLPLL